MIEQLSATKKCTVEGHRSALCIAENWEWILGLMLDIVGVIRYNSQLPSLLYRLTHWPTNCITPTISNINPKIQSGFSAIRNVLQCPSTVFFLVAHSCYGALGYPSFQLCQWSEIIPLDNCITAGLTGLLDKRLNWYSILDFWTVQKSLQKRPLQISLECIIYRLIQLIFI